jgi:hypothetical protein
MDDKPERFNPPPFWPSRINGIKDHLNRALWFTRNAQRADDARAKHWLFMAAVHSARAIYEIMLEAALKDEVVDFRNVPTKERQSAFREKYAPQFPRFFLIERLRIHDFHRGGMLPPPPANVNYQFTRGPIKLVAQAGVASMVMAPEGPVITETGNSRVEQQRPIMEQNGKIFDDDAKDWVTIEQVLVDYVNAATEVISRFAGTLDCGANEGDDGCKST